MSTKKAKLDVPKCTVVVAKQEFNIYSVKTSTHDDRCLVIVDQEGSICSHHICKQQRAVHINSQKISEFKCDHIIQVGSASPPLKVYDDIGDMSVYAADNPTKNLLSEAKISANDLAIAVQVSPTMYCVFGLATANSPSGYCHVKVNDQQIRCCSKDCKSIVARTKQLKSKSICMHVHILLSLGVGKPVQSDASIAGPSGVDLETELPLPTTSHASTIALKMKYSLPVVIPASIVRQSGVIESSADGWPDMFEPCATKCQLCGETLGQAKPHPGSRGKSLMITNLKPFTPVKVLVKFCQNSECMAMHQVLLYEEGNVRVLLLLQLGNLNGK